MINSREYTKPEDVDVSAGPVISSFRIGTFEKEDKKPKIDQSIDFASMLKWCFCQYKTL